MSKLEPVEIGSRHRMVADNLVLKALLQELEGNSPGLRERVAASATHILDRIEPPENGGAEFIEKVRAAVAAVTS